MIIHNMDTNKTKRVNVCFPKGRTHSLEVLDEARGKMPRSKALQVCIEYLAQSGPDTFKSILASKQYDPIAPNAV